MKRIKLSQGKFALVNNEDFDWLNKFKWFTLKYKQLYYAIRTIWKSDGKRYTIRMHREIMQAQKGQEIDHRNGDGLDNQRVNLRFCTHAQNIQNSRKLKNCSSKYKGVCWYKRDKVWIAYIRPNRKQIHLGYYQKEIKAAEAYNRKASELFGEFANLNIIPERI